MVIRHFATKAFSSMSFELDWFDPNTLVVSLLAVYISLPAQVYMDYKSSEFVLKAWRSRIGGGKLNILLWSSVINLIANGEASFFVNAYRCNFRCVSLLHILKETDIIASVCSDVSVKSHRHDVASNRTSASQVVQYSRPFLARRHMITWKLS